MPTDGGLTNTRTELLMETRRINERWFENRWRMIEGQKYEQEYRFHPERKWRFDYCWPELQIALEVDGGGHKMYWSKYRNDVEKMNAALFLGWRIFRITTDMVRKDDMEFLENLKAYLVSVAIRSNRCYNG